MTERLLNSEETQVEYKNLKMAADILTAMSDDDCYFTLKDCYLDYDQNWMWTTIIKINPNESGILRSCQAICSRDWKLIVSAGSKQELLEIMKTIIK